MQITQGNNTSWWGSWVTAFSWRTSYPLDPSHISQKLWVKCGQLPQTIADAKFPLQTRAKTRHWPWQRLRSTSCLWCPIYGYHLKSSQPGRQTSSLVTKGLRNLVTSSPRKDAALQTWSIPLESVLPKRQGAYSSRTYHLTGGKQSPFLPKGVLSLPVAFPFIWCPLLPSKAVLHTIHSWQEPASPPCSSRKRGISRTVKLALLRPSNEKQKLRLILGSWTSRSKYSPGSEVPKNPCAAGCLEKIAFTQTMWTPALPGK